MQEADHAWAAGFFDGEGCIDVGRNNGARQRHLPRLTVGNTNLAALERLKAILGGSISRRSPGRGERRPVWAWQVSGAKGVSEALAMMQPYLTVKLAEAEVMADLLLTFGRPGVKLTEAEHAYREASAQRLRDLKHS